MKQLSFQLTLKKSTLKTEDIKKQTIFFKVICIVLKKCSIVYKIYNNNLINLFDFVSMMSLFYTTQSLGTFEYTALAAWVLECSWGEFWSKRLSSKSRDWGNKVEIQLGAIPSKCAEMSFDPLSHDFSTLSHRPNERTDGWMDRRMDAYV